MKGTYLVLSWGRCSEVFISCFSFVFGVYEGLLVPTQHPFPLLPCQQSPDFVLVSTPHPLDTGKSCVWSESIITIPSHTHTKSDLGRSMRHNSDQWGMRGNLQPGKGFLTLKRRHTGWSTLFFCCTLPCRVGRFGIVVTTLQASYQNIKHIFSLESMRFNLWQNLKHRCEMTSFLSHVKLLLSGDYSLEF